MFRIKTKNGCLEISKEIVVVLIMDVFSAAYFLSARGLSKQSMMFPIFLLCGILIFSIMCIKQSIHFTKVQTVTASEDEPKFDFSAKLLAFLGLTLVTLLLFKTLGAVICIFLFLLISMLILGVKNKLLIVLVPLLMDVFVYLVFKVWLAVPLPTGLLTFL